MKRFFKGTFRFIGAFIALVRGIMVLAMLVVGMVTVYFINKAANITINQYNESLIWESTAYEAPLAEIEPAFVSNVIDTDAVDAAAAWEELDRYMDSLDGQQIKDRDTAKKVLDNAVYWQDIYGYKSDEITRLSLYLDLEDAISYAYTTLDTSNLQTLSIKLYDLEMEEKTKTGQQYIKRIKEAGNDFKEVKIFLTETIYTIGPVEYGILTIPGSCTRRDLAEVLKKAQIMNKFPAFKTKTDVMSGIDEALARNKNAEDYFKYRQFKENAVETCNQYTSVSVISTYGQALAFGCNIQAEDRPGYRISIESPVFGVYYEGERLDDNQYIRNGTPVTAEIDPVYEPVPEYGFPFYDESGSWISDESGFSDNGTGEMEVLEEPEFQSYEESGLQNLEEGVFDSYE